MYLDCGREELTQVFRGVEGEGVEINGRRRERETDRDRDREKERDGEGRDRARGVRVSNTLRVEGGGWRDRESNSVFSAPPPPHLSTLRIYQKIKDSLIGVSKCHQQLHRLKVTSSNFTSCLAHRAMTP